MANPQIDSALSQAMTAMINNVGKRMADGMMQNSDKLTKTLNANIDKLAPQLSKLSSITGITASKFTENYKELHDSAKALNAARNELNDLTKLLTRNTATNLSDQVANTARIKKTLDNNIDALDKLNLKDAADKINAYSTMMEANFKELSTLPNLAADLSLEVQKAIASGQELSAAAQASLIASAGNDAALVSKVNVLISNITQTAQDTADYKENMQKIDAGIAALGTTITQAGDSIKQAASESIVKPFKNVKNTALSFIDVIKAAIAPLEHFGDAVSKGVGAFSLFNNPDVTDKNTLTGATKATGISSDFLANNYSVNQQRTLAVGGIGAYAELLSTDGKNMQYAAGGADRVAAINQNALTLQTSMMSGMSKGQTSTFVAEQAEVFKSLHRSLNMTADQFTNLQSAVLDANTSLNEISDPSKYTSNFNKTMQQSAMYMDKYGLSVQQATALVNKENELKSSSFKSRFSQFTAALKMASLEAAIGGAAGRASSTKDMQTIMSLGPNNAEGLQKVMAGMVNKYGSKQGENKNVSFGVQNAASEFNATASPYVTAESKVVAAGQLTSVTKASIAATTSMTAVLSSTGKAFIDGTNSINSLAKTELAGQLTPAISVLTKTIMTLIGVISVFGSIGTVGKLAKMGGKGIGGALTSLGGLGGKVLGKTSGILGGLGSKVSGGALGSLGGKVFNGLTKIGAKGLPMLGGLIAAYSGISDYQDASHDLASGKISEAEARKRHYTAAGSASGAVLGTVLGDLAGPIGGIVGASAGQYIGGKLGSLAEEFTRSSKTTTSALAKYNPPTVESHVKSLTELQKIALPKDKTIATNEAKHDEAQLTALDKLVKLFTDNNTLMSDNNDLLKNMTPTANASAINNINNQSVSRPKMTTFVSKTTGQSLSYLGDM